MPKTLLPQRLADELVDAEVRASETEVDLIEERFYRLWGRDVFAQEQEELAKRPERPLILAADLHWDLLDIYKDFFASSGFRLSTAWSGRVLLMKNRAFKPDVIVSSLMVLGGYHPAMRWMRTNVSRKDGVPVLMCTAADRERVEPHGLLSARARYLQKPFSPKQLLDTLQELLSL